MKMGKQGVAALALLTVSLIMPAFASADGISDPTAVETTVTINYLPPTSWTTSFDGTVQLFSGTTGNFTPISSPITFSIPAVQMGTIAWPPNPVIPGNPIGGIEISGNTVTTTPTGGTMSYQILAYPSGPIGNFPSGPVGGIVSIPSGPVGQFPYTVSGNLVANDSPLVVGTWTLTETPVASPEPASLLLLGIGILSLCMTTVLNKMRTV